MGRAAATLTILAAAVALTGCGRLPDLRPSNWGERPLFERRDPAPALPADPAREAGTAESACMDAGTAAGFDVQGVVGTSEVIDATGMAVSRDVMLRVARGGQTVDVRCSYDYATAGARIMTL